MHIKLIFTLASTTLIANLAFSQIPKAVFSVTTEKTASGVVYKYHIRNQHNKPIWMIDLGRIDTNDPVLDAEPKTISSPPNWQGFSLRLEETFPEKFFVCWKQPETISLRGSLIQPGESKSGFNLILKKKIPGYYSCPFTVSFVPGNENYSGFVTTTK
ncbi:hypothetical protein [Holophaga foetida]|uniref:hypothetical protein n=1 Tax=Holophaga foetida TaxID=35839 RepID=UPI00024752F3|nr:hypothetical protein [Holophaga foetida]